jgi:hypothetical protein
VTDRAMSMRFPPSRSSIAAALGDRYRAGAANG